MTTSNIKIDSSLTIPKHIAIIMDGNGRWAQQHGLPRLKGHAAGVDTLRDSVKLCASYGVQYLTAFAFSSENWRRPNEEVQGIMQLFLEALQTEVQELNKQKIALRFVGDSSLLGKDVLKAMRKVEANAISQPRLTLIIAMNYGGRWDIIQAAKALHDEGLDFNEENLEEKLMTSSISPDPDLLIRTGGEMRVSNFMLWQAAYSELYFTPTLWPDFKEADLLKAIESYSKRERRFGALIHSH